MATTKKTTEKPKLKGIEGGKAQVKREKKPPAPGAVITPELLAQIRAKAAEHVDDPLAAVNAGMTLLVPPGSKRPLRKAAVYTLNEQAITDGIPLPKQRGRCVEVFTMAAMVDGSFTRDELEQRFPGTKGVQFWLRRLVDSGHLTVVETV